MLIHSIVDYKAEYNVRQHGENDCSHPILNLILIVCIKKVKVIDFN